MTCSFQLLKLSSCHSNQCSECLHSLPRQNSYDSIKDAHSATRVNNDRCFRLFLRKGISVFLVRVSAQFPFIPVFWGRRERRDGEEDELKLVRFKGTFWSRVWRYCSSEARITLNAFSLWPSIPPSFSAFCVTPLQPLHSAPSLAKRLLCRLWWCHLLRKAHNPVCLSVSGQGAVSRAGVPRLPSCSTSRKVC